MNTFKSMILTSFSSSSSSFSFDDEPDNEYMVTLLGAYEKNNASMLQILKSSDSSKKIGGSVVGHKYIRRDRRQGHERLFIDYFATNPVYSPTIFRRRFRMRRPLCLLILNAIQAHNSYFVQKQDAAHVVGLSSLQKMTSAMRILSYGVAADVVDDYIRIGESTAIQNLQQFCNSVIEIFGPEYLRSPTPIDIARLLAIGKVRGFPDRSPLFSDLAQGKAPPVHYTINGHSYDMGYYLADGAKKQHFAMMQESARKDVEQAFRVLQSRFAIIGGAVRFWDPKMLVNIMKSCIILHKMIVEDGRE
ncbi:uncharacterized protein LOC114280716 [Camellia sinensis]|uniref:uncharacterized protein LOC114280716 n=1 Tax=Camellia sinensis TaxID=4442 RepID=UPI0010368EC3|nr:uncharacterized protein LOC114280716 [Camellia sinensis]